MSFDERYKKWLETENRRDASNMAEQEKALRVQLGMPTYPRGLQHEATLDTVLGDILDELDTLRDKIATVKLLTEITTIRD